MLCFLIVVFIVPIDIGVPVYFGTDPFSFHYVILSLCHFSYNLVGGLNRSFIAGPIIDMEQSV